jgi:ionotropic glutamate receptor NMDA 1
MHLAVDEKDVLWPGRQHVKPEGFMIPTHLKVLTIEEKPFVYVRKLVEPQDLCTIDEIPCPHFNTSQDSKFATLCDITRLF